MYQPESNRKKILSYFYLLPLTLYPSGVAAHNVKTSGNVAATFHIEPNHNPKAGEPSQTWFALTKQGGEFVPLDQCNCKLTVYSAADTQKTAPIVQPALKAISAEQYQGIPGADIIFPKSGIYKLELSGTAKDGKSFNPFSLSYEVTVQAGKASPQATVNAPQTAQTASPGDQSFWLAPVLILAVLIGGSVLWFMKRNRKT